MSTGNLNKNSLSAKKNIRFEHELIDQIESTKNKLIPFAAWVKEACREKLERESTQVHTETPSTPQKSTNTPITGGSNAARRAKVIAFINDEIDALSREQKNSILGERYILSSLRKVTGITKSQCDSYGELIQEKLKD